MAGTIAHLARIGRTIIRLADTETGFGRDSRKDITVAACKSERRTRGMGPRTVIVEVRRGGHVLPSTVLKGEVLRLIAAGLHRWGRSRV